ncbi:hypothetical protein [Leptospira interrogans]|uniref:hypothetical protein n=1 Tax=Leptospira interrogans TaxID=173 RepID=UPI0002B92D04|nr:hypothetical protein [Leptospira interrogans]EMN53685.1 His-Xaa-Ser repeat protein HxsA [Leptospira interrogans serovar Autumnalis str. LP101]EMN79380.1 His-Xaa-Ser repeat protein HxsA [Leptospira interrogans serovar Grippotyphosa str. UI 12764]
MSETSKSSLAKKVSVVISASVAAILGSLDHQASITESKLAEYVSRKDQKAPTLILRKISSVLKGTLWVQHRSHRSHSSHRSSHRTSESEFQSTELT